MSFDINSILALPESQRRRIAEKLWDSLSPSYAVSKEEQETMALLEERWQNIQSGKSKQYSDDEFTKMVNEYRKKK